MFKITVGSAVVDGNGVKITDEKLQAELRKAGESKAMVSGSISTGFVVSGVSAKPVLDITKLEGVSTAEVTEIP